MSGAEFGYECGVFSLREGSKESMWIDPVQSLSEGRQDYLFFLPSQTLKTFCLLVFFPHPPTQVVYFTEMYNIFSELTDQIDQAGLTDEQREKETEAKLSELRALSIVADD